MSDRSAAIASRACFTTALGPTRDLGNVPWTDDDLRSGLREFLAVYPARPVVDNRGGMGVLQGFYLWFLLRQLQPAYVVESGVWRGQSTWIIEQAVPDARVFAIDPNLERLVYRSPRAIYQTRDFSQLDWSVVDPERTVLFFDDHQDAIPRLQQAKWFGFRHISFEDNYPAAQGDCYSLKQALARAGPPPSRASLLYLKKWVKRKLLGARSDRFDGPPQHDTAFIRCNIDLYYEFPPVFRVANTRWGDSWSDEHYPTKSALLDSSQIQPFQLYYADAQSYTWFAYVQLRV